MDQTTIVVYLIFIVAVILHSQQVWTNPDAFVERMRRIRSVMYKYSFGLLIQKSTKEYLDNNPKFEILLARFMFTVIYILIIYIAIASNV